MLFAITQGGEVVFAEAWRERFHKLGRMRPKIEIGRPRQPMIVNGQMYLRGVTAVARYRTNKNSD